MSLRDSRLDNIKGGLMLLVIFGHLLEPLLDYMPDLERLYDFIYLFHIPCFALLSGFVSNPWQPVKYASLFKSIFTPFIIFSLIYEVADYISSGGFSDYIKSLSPNWLLWFLLSLMLWRILAPLVLKMHAAGLALILIISLSVSFMEINGYAFSLLRTLVFFPFYIIGAMLSRYRSALYQYKVRPWMYLASAAVLLLLFWLSPPFERGMLYGSVPFPRLQQANDVALVQRVYYYPLALLAGLAFSVLVSGVYLVNRIGNHSLYVYLLHGLVVKYAVWPVVQQIEWGEQNMIYLALLLTLLLGALLSCSPVVWMLSAVINRINGLLFQRPLTDRR